MKKFVSITVSDTRFNNKNISDLSGDTLTDILCQLNLELFEKIIVPDEENHISDALKRFISMKEVDLIITTGGTGISERDITPEVTKKFIEKNIPGIPELIRASSFEKINSSALYRGYCGIVKNKIILNLPGSPGGVRDGLDLFNKILPHMFEILDGKQGH
ncbi:MAG: molybdenum cofactor biosynthesis protein [Chloroflexi bacterium]|nr:molybdenum cofactor biosynthesis protein [Chloroflexota bacterium]|tara:strand:- start:842 stop:1324 length:483 start_codon:yes stop_codon:yes gene_type:complete